MYEWSYFVSEIIKMETIIIEVWVLIEHYKNKWGGQPANKTGNLILVNTYCDNRQKKQTFFEFSVTFTSKIR